MDNSKKLIAPRPVKMNSFLRRGASKQSIQTKKFLYRNSDRVKSENIFSNPFQYNDRFFDDEELERDFSEMDAKSEILSILNSDCSLTSSFTMRDSISIFDFQDAIEDIPFATIKASNSKSIIKS
jgi:hypothetical protein